MITDDPGTPGNRHWENNLAIAFEHRPNEWLLNVPAIDLNYGWGEHIQLTFQTSAAFLKRSDHGLIGGPGGAEAAMKWRFLDEETNCADVSMFPRILFNVAHSSVRRGLADTGTRVQLPFQVAKKLGRIDVDFEFGPRLNTVSRGEFLCGIVAGLELRKGTALMAELHAESRMNFTRDITVLNFGWRHKLNEHAIWIASLGHELCSPDAPTAWLGYCGVQLVY